MLKKWLIGLFAVGLALAAAGCSGSGDNAAATNEEQASESAENTDNAEGAAGEEPAAEEVDPAIEYQKAFNAATIAEGKLNTLFHKDAAEDGTPVLNTVTKTSEAARELLLGYFEAALADQIIAHYVTDKTVDAGIVVNAEPFFPSTLQGLKFEDVTVEGTKEATTIATKDNVVYTVSWNEEGSRYIVTKIEKK
ncbi:hypothetical protein [Paenibacillus alkalitolerans]|uniref:hypothetical protein n=1 Tax=Paenibacillus alkalitolerans TaxID=2799335 RepID=UPI0018F4457D|nr:hypothetical protein [Paenibacillus alkalitolerans]